MAAEPHPEGGMRHAEMLRTIVRGITTAEANLGRVALQDALHFKLPRQAVNDFVEVQCGLYAGQNFACGGLSCRHAGHCMRWLGYRISAGSSRALAR